MNDSAVLLFHTVEDRDLHSFRGLGNVSTGRFDGLVRFLKDEFEIVGLDEYVSRIAGSDAADRRMLAITFDDGTCSYRTGALPVLESYGLPSSCFLITGCVGDRNVYWRYLLNYCVQTGRAEDLSAIIREEFAESVDAGKVLRYTRDRGGPGLAGIMIRRIFAEIVPEEEYREREGNLFLALSEIEDLRANPLVRFGVHTDSHPVLMRATDEEIRNELSKSLAFFRSNVADEAPMFSVPFGRLCRDYDERTIVIAAELGVKVIFSAHGGMNRQGQPLFNIRRIPVTETLLDKGNDAFLDYILNSVPDAVCLDGEDRLAAAPELFPRRTISGL